MLKKITQRFFSMKFALLLLVILALACTAGSVIPQGDPASYYQEAYSTQVASAILLFGFNDVFHCAWFVILTAILCLNLFGCNIIHFPALMKKTREHYTFEQAQKNWKKEPVAASKEAETVFHQLGFRKLTHGKDRDGRSCIYAVKNKAGLWGAWLCHLGMLIVILGFALGQKFKSEYTVYGVPGETRPIGDSGYALTIDDFNIALREDDTVEQYTAALTVTDLKSGEVLSGEASVNSPLSLFGMKFYQNSTGWAANLEVWKQGEKIQDTLLCAGEYTLIEDREGLAVVFSAFYPDYVLGEDGKPRTASSKMNNPGYLYRFYYHDQILGMNVLCGDEKITTEEYEIFFTHPQSYTLIQIKRDPFTGLTAFGGLLVLLALILAFYVRTTELWAVEQEDGSYLLSGRCRKGQEDFLESIKMAAEKQETANMK